MSKYKPDMRGLTEKGKKEYPRFTREEIEISACEVCKAYHTVKKYQIIKRSGRTDEIFLCDDCSKVTPEGVELLCLEETKEEEEIEFEPETDEEQGDTLLV